MKKTLLCILISVLSVSMIALFSLSGCAPAAEETAAKETAAKETAAEEPEEEDKVVAGMPVDVLYILGTAEPFYYGIENGINDASEALGISATIQLFPSWEASLQVSALDSLFTRASDFSALVICPMDAQALIVPMEKWHNAGIPVLCVDNSIGDGDFENGPVTFPLTNISSENYTMGLETAKKMAENMGGSGKAYMQNTILGFANTDARQAGFMDGLGQYPDIELVTWELNGMDASKSAEMFTAFLTANPDTTGAASLDIAGSIGMSQAISNLGLQEQIVLVNIDCDEIVEENISAGGGNNIAISQRPYDMGSLSALFAFAVSKGIEIPKRVVNDVLVITVDNVDDPVVQKYIYK